MASKELRRMNREELIEIIYALQQNEKRLEEENRELQRKLEERKITIEKAGSIAEAALQLNRIFEAAQEAADQYLLSVQENIGAIQAKQMLEGAGTYREEAEYGEK